MESKRSKRVILEIPAEIITEDKHSAGKIENLSDNGMYIVAAPVKSENAFLPGTETEISCQRAVGPAPVLCPLPLSQS